MECQWVALLALLGVACSKVEPKPRANISDNHPCKEVVVQDNSCTPEATKSLMGCLLGQSSQKIKTFEASEFKETSAFLRSAFSQPEKRKELQSLLNSLIEEQGLIKAAVKDQTLVNFINHPQLNQSFSWLLNTIKQSLEASQAQPKNVQKWLKKFNQLNLTYAKLGEIVGSVRPLLESLQEPGLNTSQLFKEALMVLSSLSKNPEAVEGLLKLSETHQCAEENGKTGLLTDSFLPQSLIFFKEDREKPKHFLNSLQQGFSFWSSVCKSKTGASQEEFSRFIFWVYQNWQTLQSFFSNEESANWIDGITELLHIIGNGDAEDTALALDVIFSDDFIFRFYDELLRNPKELIVWMNELKTFENLLKSMKHPHDPIKFSNEFIDAQAQSLQKGSLIKKIFDLPEPLLREALSLLVSLNDEQFSGLLESLETKKAEELLEFMRWMLGPADASPSKQNPIQKNELKNLIPSQPDLNSQVVIDLKYSLDIMEQCFYQAHSSDVNQCLSVNGYLQAPKVVSYLWQLSSRSQVLLKSQHPQIEQFSHPSAAKKLWEPILKWMKSSQFPLSQGVQFVGQSQQHFHLVDGIDWNPLLQSANQAFRSQLPLASGSKELIDFRRNRVTDINKDLFADKALRDFILDPRFMSRMLIWFNSPSSIEAKKSISKLASTQIKIPLWVQDTKLAPMEMNLIDAVDVLLWELQMPLVSSDAVTRILLVDFEQMRNTADLKAWFKSKIGQLDFARNLSLAFSKPGEGLHRRLDNAIRILESFYRNNQWHEAIFRASRALVLFHAPSGIHTNESAKALLALRQFGALAMLSQIMSDKAPWIGDLLNPRPDIQIPNEVLIDLARVLRNTIDKTPPEVLRKALSSNLEDDLWLLRSSSAVVMNLLFAEPKLRELFIKHHKLLLNLVVDAHSKVILPWLKLNAEASDAFWLRHVRTLKTILLNNDSTPHTAWIALVVAMAQESSMNHFFDEMAQLSPEELNHLVLWLESGIPLRLINWNRVMREPNS